MQLLQFPYCCKRKVMALNTKPSVFQSAVLAHSTFITQSVCMLGHLGCPTKIRTTWTNKQVTHETVAKCLQDESNPQPGYDVWRPERITLEIHINSKEHEMLPPQLMTALLLLNKSVALIIFLVKLLSSGGIRVPSASFWSGTVSIWRGTARLYKHAKWCAIVQHFPSVRQGFTLQHVAQGGTLQKAEN